MSHSWGYGTDNGPETWFRHFPAAAGTRQSPVDITPVDLQTLNVKKLTWRYVPENSKTLSNNGHSWVVHVDGKSSDSKKEDSKRKKKFCMPENDSESHSLSNEDSNSSEDEGNYCSVRKKIRQKKSNILWDKLRKSSSSWKVFQKGKVKSNSSTNRSTNTPSSLVSKRDEETHSSEEENEEFYSITCFTIQENCESKYSSKSVNTDFRRGKHLSDSFSFACNVKDTKSSGTMTENYCSGLQKSGKFQSNNKTIENSHSCIDKATNTEAMIYCKDALKKSKRSSKEDKKETSCGPRYSGRELSGGPLDSRFVLEQFHCHWGATDEVGSEHTVEGRQFAGELHLVHWNTRYSSFAEAAKHPDGLCVLGVFLTPGKENPEIAKLVNKFREIEFKGQSVKISTPLDINRLIPEDSTYWTYQGSLTTPPCSECVIWIVFRDPVEVSRKQLRSFRTLKTYSPEEEECPDNEEEMYVKNNFRPTLPLGQRTIGVCKP